MARWPGIESGYGSLFRGAGNLLFSHNFWFWSHGEAHFIDLHAPDQAAEIEKAVGAAVGEGYKPARAQGYKDTLLLMVNRKTGKSGGIRTSSRLIGYMPTAIVTVLVLATSLPWKRRGWALLWGVLLIQIFIVFRLTLLLLDGGFAADKGYALFDPSPFWQGAIGYGRTIFCDNPTISWLFPVFVWFLVALRSRLWKLDNGKPREAEPAPAATRRT
ncbi:MAG: hypothetical protein PVI86_18635 [Phycisphaerae bacterium]|jgi:hypothetical protein